MKSSKVFIVAFLIRFFFLLVNLYYFTLPQGGADAKRFEREAYELTLQPIHDYTPYFSSGAGIQTLVGSFIYRIFGRSELLLGLLMVVFGSILVVKVGRLAFLLWQDEKIAVKVAWFAAFFPQLILHSALFLREIPVALFLTMSIIGLVKYWKYGKRHGIYTYILFTVLATLFHSGCIASFGGVFISFLFLKQNRKSKFVQVASKIFGISLLLGGLYFMNSTGFGLNKFGGSLETAFEQFEENEMRGTYGAAAFPEWMRIRGLGDMIKAPIRLLAFLFAPLIPFLVKSFYHLLGVVDALLYLILFFRFYKMRSYLIREKHAYSCFIVGLVLSIAFALGVSNFGTAIRHRAKIAPIFIALALSKADRVRKSKDESILDSVSHNLVTT